MKLLTSILLLATVLSAAVGNSYAGIYDESFRAGSEHWDQSNADAASTSYIRAELKTRPRHFNLRGTDNTPLAPPAITRDGNLLALVGTELVSISPAGEKRWGKDLDPSRYMKDAKVRRLSFTNIVVRENMACLAGQFAIEIKKGHGGHRNNYSWPTIFQMDDNIMSKDDDLRSSPGESSNGKNDEHGRYPHALYIAGVACFRPEDGEMLWAKEHSELYNPTTISFDSEGNLNVGGYETSVVKRFSAHDGRTIFTADEEVGPFSQLKVYQKKDQVIILTEPHMEQDRGFGTLKALDKSGREAWSVEIGFNPEARFAVHPESGIVILMDGSVGLPLEHGRGGGEDDEDDDDEDNDDDNNDDDEDDDNHSGSGRNRRRKPRRRFSSGYNKGDRNMSKQKHTTRFIAVHEGKILWEKESHCGNRASAPVINPTTNEVLVSCGDRIYACDIKSGDSKWKSDTCGKRGGGRRRTESGMSGKRYGGHHELFYRAAGQAVPPSVRVDDGAVFYVCEDTNRMELIALDGKRGHEMGRKPIESEMDVMMSAPLIAGNGAVYLLGVDREERAQMEGFVQKELMERNRRRRTDEL